jgi:hypothetical protein
MSILNTKPTYFPSAIATESGWVNPITKELLVSVGGLKSKIAAEEAAKLPQPVTEKIETVQPTEEVIMIQEPVKQIRKEYTKKPKVIGEVVQESLETKQIIGEVVEHQLDKEIIAE